LFVANLELGKYLAGWDSLQTELNPTLAIRRAFEASWQEYQSFGLPAGMAHAADLIRAIFVWILTLVLPQNIVRYFFHILMLLVGGLGAFQLFRFCHSGVLSLSKDDRISDFTVFLGSLFYMLNLGTIQIFFVPFEPFSIFFAALPWEIYYFLKYLENNSRKNLFTLFLINIIATSQAYVQTMFFVYALILFVISLPFWKNWKRILVAFFTIFIVNSFWILPQLYFLKGNAVGEAKINQLATEDVYFQNKEKGNLNDFIQLKGFYYDLKKTDTSQLFTPWKNHFENPYFKYLPYFLAVIFLIGLFKRNKYQKSFVLSFLVVCIALLNDTQPFVFINDLIRQNSLINQIFRSPFTKFIIPYSLIASYFFVGGLNVILEVFQNFFRSQRDCRASGVKRPFARNDINRLTLLLTLFLLILYSLPAFTGNLFSPSMKVNIPKDYLETISYFKTVDKNQRIALLPEYTFWGWYYNNWGYNGSGFLWYGIEQPIVSRTFDVWSKTSESYYWELKTAFESGDSAQVSRVFQKYSINYLILDKSLLPVSTSLKAMQIDRIQGILSQIPGIKMIKNQNHLIIYKIDNAVKNYLYTTSVLPTIGPNISLTNQDEAFIENGDYVSQDNQNPDIYYPFADMFSQTNIPTKKWDIKEFSEYFLLKSALDIDPTKYSLSSDSAKIVARLYDGNEEVEYENTYQTFIYGRNLIVKIPKTLVKEFSPIDYNQEDCANDKKTTCFGFDAPNIDQKYSYLLAIRNKNIAGRRLFFYALDKTKNQAYIEDRIIDNNQLYLLPKKSQYNLGYSFSFQNNSYDNLSSQNILSNMDLYLFPYEALKKTYFIKPEYLFRILEKNLDVPSKKITTFWYEVELINNTQKYLVFNQSYDAGWIAISSKNLAHFKINNWANGFDISDIKNGKIMIFYLPQILEFFGLFLLLVYYILIKYENNHRT
jgi:hypothetical protein